MRTKEEQKELINLLLSTEQQKELAGGIIEILYSEFKTTLEDLKLINPKKEISEIIKALEK